MSERPPSTFENLVGTRFLAGRWIHNPLEMPEATPPEGTFLKLVKVTRREEEGYRGESLILHGPADKFLPQMTYAFTHDTLGNLDMFVVPIGELKERRDGRIVRSGFIYQAVFSWLKESPA
jgi:hypothetical protein